MFITEVKINDIILDGPNRTTVKKIEPCESSRGTKTHINDSACWENAAQVRIQS